MFAIFRERSDVQAVVRGVIISLLLAGLTMFGASQLTATRAGLNARPMLYALLFVPQLILFIWVIGLGDVGDFLGSIPIFGSLAGICFLGLIAPLIVGHMTFWAFAIVVAAGASLLGATVYGTASTVISIAFVIALFIWFTTRLFILSAVDGERPKIDQLIAMLLGAIFWSIMLLEPTRPWLGAEAVESGVMSAGNIAAVLVICAIYGALAAYIRIPELVGIHQANAVVQKAPSLADLTAEQLGKLAMMASQQPPSDQRDRLLAAISSELNRR